MTLQCKIIGLFLTTLALCACGKVGDLEPRAGQSAVPKAYGQTEAASAEALATPSVQARPGRSDELMRRSERRRDDPFDLPPGADPEKTPLPTQSSNEKPD
ncbi:MAG: hypothetical protein ACRCY3_12040 [Sphingorhabdus sp.]